MEVHYVLLFSCTGEGSLSRGNRALPANAEENMSQSMNV